MIFGRLYVVVGLLAAAAPLAGSLARAESDGVIDLWHQMRPEDRAVLHARIAAASLLVSIPVVIVFILLSRYRVSGLTLGSVKE